MPSIPDLSFLYSNNALLFFREHDLLKWGVYIIVGIMATLYFSWLMGKMLEKHLSAHHSQLLRRVIFYLGLGLSLLIPLKAAGFNISTFVGAAGILTAAVAFAAQTSISNFLSGVFLIAEKPFEIGDLITFNDVVGEVLSIDLLSVKLRTKDNTFVRIPNESLLKSQFKNLTRFPIRRFDIKIRFNSTEDLAKVKKILMEVARQNPLCLVSPAPELAFLEFCDSTVLLQFSVWGKQISYSSFQTNIQMDIQAAFIIHDIRLSSPTTMIMAPQS